MCLRSHSKLVAKPGREPVSLHSLPTLIPPSQTCCDYSGLLPTSTEVGVRIESDLRAVSNLWMRGLGGFWHGDLPLGGLINLSAAYPE